MSRSVLRWRSALVVAEIALSIALLTGSGLLLRSFVKLAGVELGFATDRVLTMNVNLPAARYATPEWRLRFFEDLAGRVEALPGVQSAGFANRFPMHGGWSGTISVDANTRVEVDLQAVNPTYFATLGIPLVRGRGFEATDRSGSPAVAIVNTAFASKYFSGREVVGQQIQRGMQSSPVTIISVVGDIRRAGKAAPIQGASRADILGIVFRQAGLLIVLGLGFGLVGSLALSRTLATLLFEIPSCDPVTFIAVAALSTTVAMVASYLRARRAAAIEPVVALRAD